MKINNSVFYSFLSIVLIVLISYIFISSYLENLYIKSSEIDHDFFIINIIILGSLLFIVTILFTFFKIYKKTYIERQIKARTQELINKENSLKTIENLDLLTQCLNKNYFLKRFNEEFKRSIRDKQFISLMIVNIDEFKSFNDIYGINEGDECLKLIANILVNHCNRPADLICRFEGDEFYILLANTKEPRILALKCIKSVKDLHIPNENSIASNVLTISIGVGTILPNSIEQMDELISNAKESLGIAKISGRNRVY